MFIHQYASHCFQVFPGKESVASDEATAFHLFDIVYGNLSISTTYKCVNPIGKSICFCDDSPTIRPFNMFGKVFPYLTICALHNKTT